MSSLPIPLCTVRVWQYRANNSRLLRGALNLADILRRLLHLSLTLHTIDSLHLLGHLDTDFTGRDQRARRLGHGLVALRRIGNFDKAETARAGVGRLELGFGLFAAVPVERGSDHLGGFNLDGEVGKDGCECLVVNVVGEVGDEEGVLY